MYCIGDRKLEDRDAVLAGCEGCIDNISKLHADIQLDVLNELHGYITEKISQLEIYNAVIRAQHETENSLGLEHPVGSIWFIEHERN